MSSPLFKLFPDLGERAGWMSLVNGPTPVHALPGASWTGIPRLFVKREDATDHRYGGNKVRNLEFLLGTAVDRGARELVTVAPLGSNFVAALAAQSRRVGLRSEVYHFVPALSPQMRAHARFSESQGAKLRVLGGGRYLGSAFALAGSLLRRALRRGAFGLSPGGSSALGALGHVNSALELAEQIRRRELPEPELLVVGVGTCGTMAGLLAGFRLAGLKTKIIGVRCVDPVFCNPLHISLLANGALRLLGAHTRIRVSDIDLREGSAGGYGLPITGAEEFCREARSEIGLELDTTYTSKVFTFLRQKAPELRGKRVLYWHTYSPAAMRANATVLADATRSA